MRPMSWQAYGMYRGCTWGVRGVYVGYTGGVYGVYSGCTAGNTFCYIGAEVSLANVFRYAIGGRLTEATELDMLVGQCMPGPTLRRC
jgi:hypothetical protein